MSQYKKRPVVIEAFEFVVTESGPVKWGPVLRAPGIDTPYYIPTLEGEMIVTPGDWIIKRIKGGFYPMKPDIFAATYEPA